MAQKEFERVKREGIRCKDDYPEGNKSQNLNKSFE